MHGATERCSRRFVALHYQRFSWIWRHDNCYRWLSLQYLPTVNRWSRRWTLRRCFPQPTGFRSARALRMEIIWKRFFAIRNSIDNIHHGIWSYTSVAKMESSESYNLQFEVILGIWTLDPKQNRIWSHCDEAQCDVVFLGIWLVASRELILNESTRCSKLVSHRFCVCVIRKQRREWED